MAVTPTTFMLGTFGVVGIAAAAVLAPRATSWVRAAEHSRVFWLTWISGFAALGFLGPATAGLGWVPMAWLGVCCAVAILQPSLIADLVEVRGASLRRRAAARRPEPLPTPITRPMPASRPDGEVAPAIRWQAPSPLPARPVSVPATR